MKEQTETLLRETKREGVEDLIKFLATSDFYTAPCSTRFHLAKKGGLVEHSLNVVTCARRLSAQYEYPAPIESVVIAAICHDLCKVNFYTYDKEEATDAQAQYLRSLCTKAGIRVPEKLNKSYASICIDHLKSMRPLPLPEFKPAFVIDDQFPLGHGEKSLYITQQFIKLTTEEALAIRWHMGGFDLPNPRHAFDNAMKTSKLVAILILADQEASYLMEAEDGK